MRTMTPDGRKARVHRRLLPWRRRVRDVQLNDASGWIPDDCGADDLAGAILLAIALIVSLPILVVALLVVGELLILLALLPLFVVARVAFAKPWIVEVTVRGSVVHAEAVVGWRAAGERVPELAAQLAAGDVSVPDTARVDAAGVRGAAPTGSR